VLDGAEEWIVKVRRILQTDVPDVGWTHDDGSEYGPTIDMRAGNVKVSTTFEEDSFNQSAFMIDDYLRRRVFDIEVEDFQ
jgi:hypothetical protein